MSHKRALVTGASAGIGRAFAQALARQGYAVTAVARREARLRELTAALPGGAHNFIAADLSHSDDLNKVVSALRGTHYQVLINNAGASVLEPFAESELAVQQSLLNLNCGATTTLAHTFLQQSETGDALINVASIVAYLPTPAQPIYSASKAFIASLSECLWEEQRHRGVYVMGLCPGITETDFIHTATGGESDGNTLPKALLQTAEEVVEEALKALQRRRQAIVVTGRANRLMMQMPRLFSRHRLIRLLAKIGDPDTAL